MNGNIRLAETRIHAQYYYVDMVTLKHRTKSVKRVMEVTVKDFRVGENVSNLYLFVHA